MRNPTSLVLAVVLGFGVTAQIAPAYSPTVTELDAAARAAGNRSDIAQHIGDTIFAKQWPAEVTQVSADELDGHLVIGVRVLGVKFHHPLTRDEFVDEVVALVESAFVSAPSAEEVDLWTSVPIDVSKGVVVSGDLAKPTSRTVFSVSVRRGESSASLKARLVAGTRDVFWDPVWARTALLEG